MTRRLFYAIEFPEPVRRQVAAAGRQLAAVARQGRWTHPDNLHLTLQFLGDCPDEWMTGLLAILQSAAAGCRPFSLKIIGCGTFGRSGDILWLGVQAGPALSQLADSLASQLRAKGLPCEDRPYSPHITIGRQVRIDPAGLRAWTGPAIELTVNQVSLMESTRIDGRLTYLPVKRVLF